MIHAIITTILIWFCLVVVMLAWEATEDPVYDFGEQKESEDDNEKW